MMFDLEAKLQKDTSKWTVEDMEYLLSFANKEHLAYYVLSITQLAYQNGKTAAMEEVKREIQKELQRSRR